MRKCIPCTCALRKLKIPCVLLRLGMKKLVLPIAINLFYTLFYIYLLLPSPQIFLHWQQLFTDSFPFIDNHSLSLCILSFPSHIFLLISHTQQPLLSLQSLGRSVLIIPVGALSIQNDEHARTVVGRSASDVDVSARRDIFKLIEAKIRAETNLIIYNLDYTVEACNA